MMVVVLNNCFDIHALTTTCNGTDFTSQNNDLNRNKWPMKLKIYTANQSDAARQNKYNAQ